MKTYFDTSVLLKSYIPEAGTPEALAIIRAAGAPFPFSHLLELELRTAIRIKHGRGEITVAEKNGALQALEKDIAAGVMVRPDYGLEEVFRRAESISSKHAAGTLARSADLWHVAAALESGCAAFASFDERQRSAAALCAPRKERGAAQGGSDKAWGIRCPGRKNGLAFRDGQTAARPSVRTITIPSCIEERPSKISPLDPLRFRCTRRKRLA